VEIIPLQPAEHAQQSTKMETAAERSVKDDISEADGGNLQRIGVENEVITMLQ
jgi:hypothetical protein